MGNCLRLNKDSPVDRCGDDWGSSYEKTRIKSGSEAEFTGEASLVGGYSAPSTQVKIKISKQQLEKLLSKADIEGLSVQEVVTMLKDSGDRFEVNQRTWKPALNSIPE